MSRQRRPGAHLYRRHTFTVRAHEVAFVVALVALIAAVVLGAR